VCHRKCNVVHVTMIAYCGRGRVRSEVRGQGSLNNNFIDKHRMASASCIVNRKQVVSTIRILDKRSNWERRVMVKVMKLCQHAPWDPDQPPPGPTDLRPRHPQVIGMQYHPLIRPLRRHQAPKTNFKRLS